jgi:hypothetical protein
MRRWASFLWCALATAGAQAQSGRQALAAGTESYLLADYQRAVPLLSLGLDPGAAVPDQAWVRGVQRLADVLLVLRQDSLATTWLRWATRLSPDFAVDEDAVPPAVVRAARRARAFVDSTPSDPFVSRTEFRWPPAFRSADRGTVRLSGANVPITARIGPDQFLRGGESRVLPIGSYDVVVSAPGYLPARFTIEVLPGVETLVHASPLPETAGLLYVSARPWGTLFIDGQRVGYTGVAGHRVLPGSHALRLVRDSAAAIDTTIQVAERQPVRLSWVTVRDTTGAARLDSAGRILDAGDTERGAELLRLFLLTQPATSGATLRAVALARLAEALWTLRVRDSARACLRIMVEADPFYAPPGDRFNPELRAAYQKVRREVPVIGLHAPADTVLVPARDSLPLALAVGRPGDVRLYLRPTTGPSHDSLLAVISVDGLAAVRLPLTTADGTALPPGPYAIEGNLAGSALGNPARDVLAFTVQRLAVDTSPHLPPPSATVYLPQVRRGRLTRGTVLEGIGLGAAVVLVPIVINDGDLSGRSVPVAAGLLGTSIALLKIALTRPNEPIQENVRFNELQRTQWETRNRKIAVENALRLRRTPLRVRTTESP